MLVELLSSEESTSEISLMLEDKISVLFFFFVTRFLSTFFFFFGFFCLTGELF
jgi:hypothetical protein